jgi:hypothetical protein
MTIGALRLLSGETTHRPPASSSGNLAMLAAIRVASSRLRSLVAARLPGSSSKRPVRKRQATGQFGFVIASQPA